MGGYGEVWSAQAPGGLTKAIKFVYGYFDDARAARELKALDRIKQVRHPFLLSLERFEIVDGQLIIVTELADMSLKDRFEQLKQSGAVGIPRDELLAYLRDAADALDYMSENFSLQHLDVKPENLLLVGGRVKVADFGLVKDLHDVTASMMGGLTPIYAAPEVFDDRPSQRSDQYSLAIVYQEMLTGILPFPGRTPAQLASQHLHASPRLSSLPGTDQPVIATALAKDPAQRFVNCRSMVDALLSQAMRGAAPEMKPAGGFSTNDTEALKSRAVQTDTDARRAARPGPAQTQVLDADSPPLSQSRCAALAQLKAAAEPVVDLPPLDLADVSADLRPTLFLGIGGTAGRVLRQLRRRLQDRFNAAASLAAMPMLVLDTDAKSLYQLTQGDAGLADGETLALPLRAAHDYATDSRNILTWLSRRWLYNIPRSLQTDGRRPLGRLALVDHAPQVLKRLRDVLAAMTGDDAIAAAAATTGRSLNAQAPRIVLMASISGGTGGGMVLDLAYTARHLLSELACPDADLCTILLHATDRNPAAGELATANAYACLAELQHYREAGYQAGAKPCGLPAADGAVVGPTYFVPLGHELNDQEFEAATDRVASYLYLSAVTSAAGVLDKCRSLVPADSESVTLHGLGIASIGSLRTPLPAAATELVCQGIVNHWRGAGQVKRDSRLRTPIVDLAAERARSRTLEDRIPSAGEHAAQLALDVSRLREGVAEILDHELGGDADAVFGRLRAKIDAQGQLLHPERTARLLEAVRRLFDPPTVGEDGLKLPPPALPAAIDRGLKQLAASKGQAIRDWILALVDHPASRVGGAARARDAYAAHLRELQAEAARGVQETQQNLRALEHWLVNSDKNPPVRARVFGTRRAEQRRMDEADRRVALVVRLRIQELTLEGVVKLVRLLEASVSAAGDQIKDLQRELGQWAERFDADWPYEDDAAPSADSLADEVERHVAAQLRTRLGELAQRVDDQVQSRFVEPGGGLRTVCQKAETTRGSVLDALRSAARAEVLAALKEISIDDALLGGGDPRQQTERLQACLASARPKLLDCAGSQRLLAVLPTGSAGGALQSAISQHAEPQATLLTDADPQLILCFEQQELSLAHVAARLVEGRKDLIEIAARLHTRADVAWTDLPLPGNGVAVGG